MKFLIILSLLLFSSISQAERSTKVIKFAEEELARESVIPKFKKTVAVKKRNVPKTSRFELGLNFSNQLTEAFYEPYAIGGSVYYHFNEFHGLELSAMVFSTSESQFVDILNEDVNPVPEYNFDNAPAVESILLAGWEFTPYYGKISLTKQSVMNLSVYTVFNIGLVDNGLSSTLAYGLGLGQKIYFSPNWGLKIELKGLFYDAVDPLSNETALQTGVGTYKEENKFNLMLNVGLLTMLPFL